MYKINSRLSWIESLQYRILEKLNDYLQYHKLQYHRRSAKTVVNTAETLHLFIDSLQDKKNHQEITSKSYSKNLWSSIDILSLVRPSL